MSNYNLLIAGFGGQGVLFFGRVLAHAGLISDKEVSWLPSYGPEMRGGTANCSVCLSDSPIGSPLVTQPDILIALNSPSFDKFIGDVLPGGKVIIDCTLVQQDCNRDDIKFYKVPATKEADKNNLDNLANMIILGKLLAETEIFDLDTIEKALGEIIPESKRDLIEPNMQAIRLGMEQ